MTLSSIDKITAKSKNLIFEARRSYRPHGRVCVPYGEEIVSNPDHPDRLFLVHRNLLMDRGSVCDTSYTVYSFDIEGEYIGREDEKPPSFFTKSEVVKKII